LEALRGIRTIQQIAKEYQVHPGQVADWKKTAAEGLPGIFEPGALSKAGDGFERERETLLAKIGALSVQVDFLSKKSKQLGL